MKTLKFLIISIFLISSNLFSQNFEGTIFYKISISGEGSEMLESMMPNGFTFKFKEKLISYEIQGGMVSSMIGRIIIDSKNNTYMLKDSEKTAYKMTNTEISKADILLTDEKAGKIGGYNCQKYQVFTVKDGQDVQQEIWASKDLKVNKVKNSNLGDFFMDGIDGFPLKIVSKISTFTIVIEAASIKKEKLKKSFFSVPKGYKITDYVNQ